MFGGCFDKISNNKKWCRFWRRVGSYIKNHVSFKSVIEMVDFLRKADKKYSGFLFLVSLICFIWGWFHLGKSIKKENINLALFTEGSAKYPII